MWRLQWSDKRDFLEDLEDKGIPVKALQSEPKVPDFLEYYLTAFNTLSSRRQVLFHERVGQIEQPIAISEMLAYLVLYPWYDNDLFVSMMVVLDTAYLNFRAPSDGNKENSS